MRGEEIMSKVLVPDNCPYCGAKVIWTSNEILYGKVYGNGKCYYCTGCGASVGAHKNRPKEPLGILATPPMKRWKKLCHSLFDPVWKSRQISRGELYSVLACKLGIPKEDCHFGHFNEEQLKRAWQVIKEPNWWR